jgi:hypothetical protein
MTNMTTTMTKKECALNQHYWNNEGVYQADSERLYSELVPQSDNAPTIHGEMIRCIHRLYYEFCNNGNGNAIGFVMEDCSQCGGSGYEDDDETDCEWCGGDCMEETDVVFESYYEDMVEFLKMNMQDKEVIFHLEDWLLETFRDNYTFSDEQMSKYDKVLDAVVFQCLTTENKPNPLFKN